MASLPLSIPAPLVDAWAAMQGGAASIASTAGMDFVLIKFVLCVYAAFFLAWPQRALPPAVRHAWSAGIGLFMITFIFEQRAIYPIGLAALCYAVLFLTASIRALDGWRHLVTAVGAFGYLSFRHAFRGEVNATSIDELALLMVMTVKIYTLSYNVYDGSGPGKRAIDTVLASTTAKDAERRIMTERRERAVPGLPSPLVYAGYMFNFTSVLAGPAFEVSEYIRSQSRASLADAPGRVLPATLTLLIGAAFMAAGAVIAGQGYTCDAVYAQAVAALERGGFDPLDIAKRLAFLHVALFAVRCNYYAVWKIAEAASIAAGFGLVQAASPAAAASNWDGVANVQPVWVELSWSLDEVIKIWNQHTQSWLGRYVFLRAPKSVGFYVTYFASAFWHGFFPGYYLGFFTVAFIQSGIKRVIAALGGGKRGGPPPSIPSKFLQWLLTMFVLDYALSAFCLLDAPRGLLVWRSLFFMGHVLGAVLVALGAGLEAAAPRKPKAAAAAPAAAEGATGKGKAA